jgi:hypothetical protein
MSINPLQGCTSQCQLKNSLKSIVSTRFCCGVALPHLLKQIFSLLLPTEHSTTRYCNQFFGWLPRQCWCIVIGGPPETVMGGSDGFELSIEEGIEVGVIEGIGGGLPYCRIG